MTINALQDEVIEEFSALDDWMDKYQMLIDLGGELPALDEQKKTPGDLVEGCTRRVWVGCHCAAGGRPVEAGGDAMIVKGIVALLLRVLSGHSPAEILNSELYFIEQIGLREHLSPTRSNGLVAMVKQIMAYALIYSKS